MPPLFRILFSPLLAIIALTSPAVADNLDPSWQTHRDYYNALSKRACDGDRAAIQQIDADFSGRGDPNLSEQARAVADYTMAWMIHPDNDCPPLNQYKSLKTWKFLVYRSYERGYPVALAVYGNSEVSGSNTIKQNRTEGLEKLYLAAKEGYSFAAVRLADYHLRTDYGFVPDRFFAGWFIWRAERLGRSAASLERLKARHEELEHVTRPPQIERRLQGAWSIQSDSVFSSAFGPGVRVFGGRTMRTYSGGDAKDQAFTIDAGTCPGTNRRWHRMQYGDRCALIDFESPYEFTLTYRNSDGSERVDTYTRILNLL